MLAKAFLAAIAIKLILIPAYKSTDFEVHRNWMAITHCLPITEWYTDTTSEWTMDYPPLFAWFEYLLSHIAYYFDPDMLVLSNHYYDSGKTILFMRLSVIISDFVLAWGCKEVADYILRKPIRKCSKWRLVWSSPVSIFYVLVLNNMGLFIVDHIHFQYNGLFLGILLLSMGNILNGSFVTGTIWFTVLINMKHIFLYMAPAFGIYTLRNYCMPENGRNILPETIVWRICKLASIVVAITSISFGPFILAGQLPQIMSRLFPFQRGLCHAYWAPNFWALYNTFDKILVATGRFTSYIANRNFFLDVIAWIIKWLAPIFSRETVLKRGSMTSGVLQNYEHVLLPQITPMTTAVLVFISVVPCLVKLWTSPGNPLHFVRAVVICTSCAFLFGWHVHEKAILMIIIPLSFMAVLKRKEAEVYILLSTTGHFSLLPLIFTAHEFSLKIVMFLLSAYYVISTLSDLFQVKSRGIFPTLNIWENIYVCGLIAIFIYDNLVEEHFELDKRFPYLPLLMTAFYCALGITYCTVKYYFNFLTMYETEHKQKTF